MSLLIGRASTALAADPQAKPATQPVAVLPSIAVISPHAEQALRQLPDAKELGELSKRNALFTGHINDQSVYGKGWFPETLRNAQMDLDYRVIRLDWFHAETHGHQEDEIRPEFDLAYHALTLDFELPYFSERNKDFDPNTGETETENNRGIEHVEIGARYPLFQLVSDDGRFDYTCVGAFEFALPVRNKISKDGEVSPRIYNLLRLGDHFSVQAAAGTETLIGPERGGSSRLIYGVTLAYSLFKEDLGLPGINAISPMFEVTGEYLLSGEGEDENNTHRNHLFGTVGFRINTKSLPGFQPRIGVGYVFPMDDGARNELRWGIVTSFVFEL